MSSPTDDIIATMAFAAQQGLVHFVQQDGKTRLSLWREPVGTAVSTVRPAPESSVDSTVSTTVADSVMSPLTGLCHLSPDPGSPPFVSEGGRIEKGQTICLIEAMKVMTAVPADQSGTVCRIIVPDGAMVRAGDPLIEVQP